MKSFALLRTNVALTTNIKIVVSSDYQLYMESIDSNQYLSDDKFKKRQFPIDTPYSKLIPTFYQDMSPKHAYGVKYDNDNDKMFNDFSNQFDDTYQYGCSNVKNTDYNEEFECFAPLHFEKNSFPKSFMIFRVDGPGLINLTKDNFKTEILDNLKCVKLFDLSNASNLGQWIKKSFKDDVSFPEFKFNLDVRNDEFSEWSGIDYSSGGYTTKSLFMKDVLEMETTFFEFDKLLTSSYQDLKVVYPNILNLSFLFDDTPATKTSLRKWSINRYYGFYIDSMDLVKCVSPYSPPKLNSGFTIKDDNIFSGDKDPFTKGFISGSTFVEYLGQFYEVKKLSNNTYKIICPFDLKGKQSLINKEVINIDSNNFISYNSDYNTNTFSIDCFDSADVWVIKINDRFHTIKSDNGSFYIHTDYGFKINNNKLEYWINESDTRYRTTIQLNLVDSNNLPMTFPIYKLNFTDIKDFDTSIINSDYARYEYEKSDFISDTLEPKLFTYDESSVTNPKEFNEYIFNNELVRIPASSEYVGTGEVFEINNPSDNFLVDLSDIWRKNPVFSKWGFEGSLSNGDYPYRLNNNFYGEDMNRSTNVYEPLPNRMERNLDYFYTINPDSNVYIDHTLHISGYNNGELDTDFKFEIDKYFNVGTVSYLCCDGPIVATYTNNYFDYLFTKKEYLDSGNLVRNTNKYSTFLQGDNSVPNSTVFRGIKFNVYNVDKVLTDTDQNGKISINSISVLSNNNYEDWKFSILLSDFDYNIDDPNFKSSSPTQSIVSNNMEWEILDIWKLENSYTPNDVVLFHDILYINTSGTTSIIEDPSENPSNSIDWELGTFSSVFWNPGVTYSSGDWVYNAGEYYLNNGVGTTDFYDPGQSYNYGDSVIYQNNYYNSLTSSNTNIPNSNNNWSLGDLGTPLWDKILQWSSNTTYPIGSYTYFQGSLYISNIGNSNNQPNTSTSWNLVYSFEPDTDKIYGTDIIGNNIIQMNNRYYLLLNNPNNNTLDNGINIYINKKWKNILVNIYINDNTIGSIRNVNRDELYSDINQKLTAKNFIDCINDMDNSRGFSNYINYYVIEDDLSYTKYNIDNITELPVILNAEDPDEFEIIIGSMIRKGIVLNQNIIKSDNRLNDNEIKDISQINFFNGNPIALDLSKVSDDEKRKLSSKSKNYRFNGNYSPIFREVSLFKRPEICNLRNGNYIFDTELSDFGMMKERIVSKVNLNDNVLKLQKSSTYKSIYPQLDEFGYTFNDHFIFKSTWDSNYYIKVTK